MKFLLVRHGETDWNIAKRIQGSTDIPLNKTGILQAAVLAEKLSCRATPITAVYTSKLLRAKQTGEAIAQKFSIHCQTVPGLEELNFGLWEGICWEEVESQFPKEYLLWHQNRRYKHPPGGESYNDLLLRVLPVLKNLRQKHAECKNSDIVVVTHSACIMALLSLFNNTPFHEMIKRYKLANTAVVELDADTNLDIEHYKK